VRNFADKKCGGKGRALKSAKQYRDVLLRKYPPFRAFGLETLEQAHEEIGFRLHVEKPGENQRKA
jgi:hypothetical protein